MLQSDGTGRELFYNNCQTWRLADSDLHQFRSTWKKSPHASHSSEVQTFKCLIQAPNTIQATTRPQPVCQSYPIPCTSMLITIPESGSHHYKVMATHITTKRWPSSSSYMGYIRQFQQPADNIYALYSSLSTHYSIIRQFKKPPNTLYYLYIIRHCRQC